MKTKFRYFLSVCCMTVLLILMGCSGVSSDRVLTYKQEDLHQQGKPPAYVDGYIDGCSSGMRMGGDNNFQYRKDVQRAERDALYAKGWDDGQICCRNEALVEKQRQAEQAASGIAVAPRAADPAVEAEVRELWEQIKK